MARIATLEEMIDLRGEEDIDAKNDPPKTDESEMDTTSSLEKRKGFRPLIPTLEEMNEAFQSIITLRYSQPTHLAGESTGGHDYIKKLTRENRKVSRNYNSTLFCRSHDRRYHLENSVSVCWNDSICRQPQPSERKTLGWIRSNILLWWRHV